ncbi:hypothetical protein [Herpetosiphon giganteus]|uniref:hypothetical protein n=1 Tax=Herpetosiphon giganteus TaxID=2029754 RepID=UPI001958FDC9|nr:hypothetical protein [Herpetosiphon giganteus]MBM7844857.1 hypothetical protein [Herpetosiphon giganteus]
MNQEILAQTLQAIQKEYPNGDIGEIGMWLGRLLEDAGEEQLAERLDAAIDDTWPWEIVGVLFEALSWWTSDEGSALLRTTEGWLREGTNLRRIQIALAQDTFPFRDANEMFRVLEGIAQRFPEVADTCQRWITWRHEHILNHGP